MGTLGTLLILVGVFLLARFVIWPLIQNFVDGAMELVHTILPYLIGGGILLGTVLLSWFCTDSFGGFIVLLIENLLVIGLFAFVIWLFESKKGKKVRDTILYGGLLVYLVYSLIKNIIISESFSDFIINEIVSILLPVILGWLLRNTFQSRDVIRSIGIPGTDLERATFADIMTGNTCDQCKYYQKGLGNMCRYHMEVIESSDSPCVCSHHIKGE